MMPADFSATEGSEIDPNASTTVLLQSRAGDGVQILISPWDEPASALTAERVTQDTGLTVTNVEPIAIPGGVGLSFNSNNDAFDGASSDIWFVHTGNVYELTTYGRPHAVGAGSAAVISVRTLIGICAAKPLCAFAPGPARAS
jgi:hypothetical protein